MSFDATSAFDTEASVVRQEYLAGADSAGRERVGDGPVLATASVTETSTANKRHGIGNVSMSKPYVHVGSIRLKRNQVCHW